jgi:hypothetical protein
MVIAKLSKGHCCIEPSSRSQSRIARMLHWSGGDGQIVEGDAEPVASLDVGGDVIVAAAQILHKGVTGGEDPR